MVLEIIIIKFSSILKIMSRNTFPEPQPDSASYTHSNTQTVRWTLPLKDSTGQKAGWVEKVKVDIYFAQLKYCECLFYSQNRVFFTFVNRILGLWPQTNYCFVT